MRALASLVGSLALAGGAASAAELAFSITVPDGERLVLGEPVVALATLVNNGDDVVRVVSRLDPEGHRVRYFIRYETEDEVLFRPWAFEESVAPFRNLSRGEPPVVSVAKLFFGAGGWTFRRPGRYAIRAVYAPGIEARAELLIAAPAGQDEAAARLLLESKEAGYFLLLEGGDNLKDGISRLEKIASTYPTSRLAGYAHFALARSLESDFVDLVTGTTRPANLQMAANHLNLTIASRLTAYFDLRARKRLEMVYAQIRPELAPAVRADLAAYTAQPRGGISPARMKAVLAKEKD